MTNTANPELFETLWHALPSPAVVLESGEVVIAANAAAEQLFSSSQRALKRRKFSDFAPEGSRLAALIQSAMSHPSSMIERDLVLSVREGAPVPVDVQITPLNDAPASNSLLIVLQPRSIAEKMDRSLVSRGAARSLSGMTAALAHEIKNPLAAISGAAQLLQDTASDQEAELTELIDEEVGRIRRLLDKMESFTDSRPPDRAPVNLHDALGVCRKAAQAGFARGVRFVEDYDPSLPPTVGDRDQLARAFQNLVKNAADALQGKGEIVLRTAFRPGVRLAGSQGARRESLPLEVSVIDNGPGVPDELRPFIFEPFVTSKSAGSGLGLALVSKIVSDHGGIIECDSGEGRTSFRMLLPVWRAADLEAAE